MLGLPVERNDFFELICVFHVHGHAHGAIDPHPTRIAKLASQLHYGMVAKRPKMLLDVVGVRFHLSHVVHPVAGEAEDDTEQFHQIHLEDCRIPAGDANHYLINADIITDGIVDLGLGYKVNVRANSTSVRYKNAEAGQITIAGTGRGNTYHGTYLKGSLVWDPGNLIDGAGEVSGVVTVTGATVGDGVRVFPPYSTQGIIYSGTVSAADSVLISLFNKTGGAIDLGSASWKVKVYEY